jgi:predicted transcriptional regulator
MSTTKHYARIAITLPTKDLASADRLARTQDRSRSWIVAEAIRRYAAESEGRPVQATDTAGSAAAATTPAIQSGLGASRLAQLTRDLQLTPEARVLAAEETLRQTGMPRRPRRHQLLAFDRYEEFLDWKKTRNACG